MNNSEVDKLGDRLRIALTDEDLTLLDAYRRAFRTAYDQVINRIRNELHLEVSGRPAKSTTAIVDKLKRGSMRLSQMQDIAGCRIVIPDITLQDRLVDHLEKMFKAKVYDRREKPSHGYRAVHVVVQDANSFIEVQVRTSLQHAWAELSEKVSDRIGIEVKYGGGPKSIQYALAAYSGFIEDFEDAILTGEVGELEYLRLYKGLKEKIPSRITEMIEKLGSQENK